MFVPHTCLHNHAYTEYKEGLIKDNLVIVDKEFSHLFESIIREYNDSHIIVTYDDFEKNGGKLRMVAVR